MRLVDWLLCALAILMLGITIVYRDPAFRESLRYTLQGIALMPIFFYAIRFPSIWPFKILNIRVLVRIGILSYGIYLIHVVAIEIWTWLIGDHISTPAMVAFTLATSVAFAVLIDRLVDPYFRRRRAQLH